MESEETGFVLVEVIHYRVGKGVQSSKTYICLIFSRTVQSFQ